MQPYTGQKPDEGLDVEFYLGSVPDTEATEKAKKPVFKEVPFVRIRIPGNRDEVIDTEAWVGDVNEDKPFHNRRFPFAWQRFQAQAQEGVTGFPLKEWAGITRAAVDTLAHFNIRSVQQLAQVSDGNLQKLPLPNPVELRQRAKDFLEQADSAEALRAELQALRAKLEAMEAKPEAPAPHVRVIPAAAEAPLVEAQEAKAAAPKRRGRPPKAASATP